MRVPIYLAALIACGAPRDAPTDDAVTGDAPTGDAASGLVIRCAEQLPIAMLVASSEAVSIAAACSSPPTHPSPAQGCRLDLRQLAPGAAGTCAAPGTSVIEIDGPTQLPIVIDLPEGMSDPACGPACQRAGEPTPAQTFGVRVRVNWPPQGGPFVSMRVDPPWGLVAGNECAPSLCADGYPSVNEFGRPLACVFTYCKEVGVLTDHPSPPPARLTMLPSDVTNQYSSCCLFPTE